MHHGRRSHGGREIARLAIHEDIDVGAQAWTGLHEAIADPRHARFQLADDGGHRPGGHLMTALDTGEERQERARQQDGGQASYGQLSRTTDSTDQMAGRSELTRPQLTPASALCQSWPVPVPKAMPTGSSVSRAIASRRTDR